MTRKDYILIAAAFLDTMPRKDSPNYAVRIDEWDYIASVLTAKLGEDNARFDNAKFLKACGVTA